MKLPYREGDWFAVPLEGGGFAVGIVARMAKRGRSLVGYFFGPKREVVPTRADVAHLVASDAILVARFGDLSLIQHEWPVIGRAESWDREAWPMPVFYRAVHLVPGRAFRVRYDPERPSLCISEEVIAAPANLDQLPKDCSYGSGALAYKLSTLVEPSAFVNLPRNGSE